MAENAQKRTHSAAAIVGIVLGALALLLSWVPIINNLAIGFAVIGLIFAVAAVVSTVRGRRTGKGLAIAAAIVSVIAIVVVIGTQGLYKERFDNLFNGTAPAGTAPESGSGSAKGDHGDLALGTTVKLENGLSVTVDSVQSDLTSSDGTKVIGVHVTYANKSDKDVTYNSFDWRGENAQRVQESSTYYSEATEALHSGTLAAGGTVAGNLYFKDGTVKAIYSSSLTSKGATASWKLS